MSSNTSTSESTLDIFERNFGKFCEQYGEQYSFSEEQMQVAQDCLAEGRRRYAKFSELSEQASEEREGLLEHIESVQLAAIKALGIYVRLDSENKRDHESAICRELQKPEPAIDHEFLESLLKDASVSSQTTELEASSVVSSRYIEHSANEISDRPVSVCLTIPTSTDEMWVWLKETYVHHAKDEKIDMQTLDHLGGIKRQWHQVLKLSHFIRPHLVSRKKKKRFLSESQRNREQYAEFLYWQLYVVSVRRDDRCSIEHHVLDELRDVGVSDEDLKVLDQSLLHSDSSELFTRDKFLETHRTVLQYGSQSIRDKLQVLEQPAVNESNLFTGCEQQVVDEIPLLLSPSLIALNPVKTKSHIPFWRIDKKIAAHIKAAGVRKIGLSCATLSIKSRRFSSAESRIQSLEVFDPWQVLGLLKESLHGFCVFRTSLEREYQTSERRKHRWFKSLFRSSNQLFTSYQKDQLKIYQTLLCKQSQLIQDVSKRFKIWLKRQERDYDLMIEIKRIEAAFRRTFEQMKEACEKPTRLCGDAPTQLFQNMSDSYDSILRSIGQYEKKVTGRQQKAAAVDHQSSGLSNADQEIQQNISNQSMCNENDASNGVTAQQSQPVPLRTIEEEQDYYLEKVVKGRVLKSSQLGLLCSNARKMSEDHSSDLYHSKAYELAETEQRLNAVWTDIQERKGVLTEENQTNLLQIISYLKSIHHEELLNKVRARLFDLYEASQSDKRKSVSACIKQIGFSKDHWLQIVQRDRSQLIEEERKARSTFDVKLKEIVAKAEGIPWHTIFQQGCEEMLDRGIFSYVELKSSARKYKSAEEYVQRKHGTDFCQTLIRTLEEVVTCVHRRKQIDDLYKEYEKFIQPSRWLVSDERMGELYRKYGLADLHSAVFDRVRCVTQGVYTI